MPGDEATAYLFVAFVEFLQFLCHGHPCAEREVYTLWDSRIFDRSFIKNFFKKKATLQVTIAPTIHTEAPSRRSTAPLHRFLCGCPDTE